MMNIVIKDKAFTKVDTYELSLKGFYMEVVTYIGKYGKTFDAYLYHEDYDIKEYMFGILAGSTSYADFLQIVEANLSEHALSYVMDYMDYDEAKNYLDNNENNDDCTCCDCHGYCPYEREGEE